MNTELLKEQITKTSKLNDWGGILEGDFGALWDSLKQLEANGFAKRQGLNLTYQVEINGSYYTVRENDGGWQILPKTKDVKTLVSNDELSKLEMCYLCGYNIATDNGKCVSCMD